MSNNDIIRLIAQAIICFLCAAGIAIAATSCKTIKVVPEIHTEYVHDTISRVDSVWKDRWHTEYMRGDTVYIRDSVWNGEYKWRDKVVEVYKTDSIPYPVEVEKQVKYVPGYYHFTSWAFWIVFLCIVLVVCWRLYRKIR